MANPTLQPTPPGDSYAFATCALVIAEPGAGARAAVEALGLAGVRTAGEVGFADAQSRLADQLAVDLILVETAGAPDALLDPVLARADAVARECGAAVVAAIGEDQIDVAAAHLLGRNRHLLCTPNMAERVGALAVARGRAGARLNDASRDSESARLQRLNEEVARIADTLARLTRGEEGERRNGVRASGSDYRGPTDDAAAETSAQEIRAAIRSRRLRSQFFAGELFADPAWDMLLDLFAAQLEQRRVSVSSLCIAAAVPPTTALRWIGTLHDAGLFERHADPADRRRAYIALSAKGLEGMHGYVAAAKRQGLSIV